jgi:hypothetical protein
MNNILNHQTNIINKNKIDEINMNVIVMMVLTRVQTLVVVTVISMKIQHDEVFHSQIQIFAPNAARKTQISF